MHVTCDKSILGHLHFYKLKSGCSKHSCRNLHQQNNVKKHQIITSVKIILLNNNNNSNYDNDSDNNNNNDNNNFI